ncbi:MAG: ATP-dependent DNA helicase RecG [Bacteriovoracaceae bacterium]|nr:ATP-dependent DNA helicase RecG [Bacteriovoracaceae bacterium]
MRSKTLPTVELNWHSPLEALTTGKKPSPTITKLSEAGLNNLFELLWILPLRIHKMPTLQPFREAVLNQFFKGSGKVIHVDIKPAFGRRGKGNIMLFNGYVVVKDDLSNETLSLRWFNLYPNQKKQIESLDHIAFLGQVQEFKAQKQVTNPQIIDPEANSNSYIIEYPTVNKIAGNHLKKVLDLIPKQLWEKIPQTLPELGYDSKLTLGEAFKVIHGKTPITIFDLKLKDAAEERLIYEEFLIDQLKIQTRRKFIKRKDAPVFSLEENKINDLVKHLPFELTSDQLKVFFEILKDFKSGHPMMRMVQGDVGCGKTIVAFLAARVANRCGYQVGLMCPTEALATQHFESFRQLNPVLNIDLLLGSTKAKEKKAILKNLADGVTDIVIGTHALFQDSVKFKQLGLAIIDEQHKFGVEQRLRLVAKGEGTHSLIMTATPIPRTLSLAQYGDLDISSIKMMPAGRKGIKTRITEKLNYPKYVEFVKARLAMGEQAYFVFPAIEESETMDLQNVKDSLKKYQEIFKGFKVDMLHGQMKSEEKEKTVQDFRDKKTNILVSTSVIEVGINVPNATIMSIYNPERFGLSSLHQLRGRVGRGDKPGFCFLVLDKEVSPVALERLRVIENNLDGFVIAEEDLKFRGEGDIFGVDQSGTLNTKKLASFLTHTAILERVVADVEKLQATHPELLAPHFERLAKDQKILDTI